MSSLSPCLRKLPVLSDAEFPAADRRTADGASLPGLLPRPLNVAEGYRRLCNWPRPHPPSMGDFRRDGNDNGWFHVVGKGNGVVSSALTQ